MARPRKNLPPPIGRPIVPINWDLVDRLLKCGCDGVEVAARLGIHPNTFYDRVKLEKGFCFAEYSLEKKSEGKSLLREKQFIEAMKGNTQLLLRLGEFNLGQTKNATTPAESLRSSIISDEDNENSNEGLEVASKQPVQHKECSGEKDPFSPELGASGTDWNPSQI